MQFSNRDPAFMNNSAIQHMRQLACPCCCSNTSLLSHNIDSDVPALAPGPPAGGFQNCNHCFEGLTLTTAFLCTSLKFSQKYTPSRSLRSSGSITISAPSRKTSKASLRHLIFKGIFEIIFLRRIQHLKQTACSNSRKHLKHYSYLLLQVSPIASYRPHNVSSAAPTIGSSVRLLGAC